MITRIRGILTETEANFAVLDVNGIFYQVFCPRKTLDKLCDVNATYTLYTEFVVREDSMSLYGFFTKQELESFKFITNVQGVGMKVGIAILSIATPDEIYHAINANDKAVFTQADGVGPKLASRIINELKDKMNNLTLSNQNNNTTVNTANKGDNKVQDAVSALINLGYKTFDANQAVQAVQQQANDATVEELIKLSLSHLVANK